MNIELIYMLLALVFTMAFVRNICIIVFSLENYNIHKKRLKELYKSTNKQKVDTAELVDTITKPIIKYLLPKINIKNTEEIEKDLKLSGFNKYFSVKQFIAFRLGGQIAGVLVFLLLFKFSLPIAIIWSIILILGPSFLLSNTVSRKKEKLLSDFPDFIRITQGYLTAGMPFIISIQKSLKYVSPEWKPIIKEFIAISNTRGIEEALDYLKNAIDMFEVTEFVSLIELTLEQGGEIVNSFENQAQKILKMQKALVELKIQKRQAMGIIVQAPILLCCMMVFGLPTIYNMINMKGM